MAQIVTREMTGKSWVRQRVAGGCAATVSTYEHLTLHSFKYLLVAEHVLQEMQ